MKKGRSNVGISLVPWEIDKYALEIKVPFTYGALQYDLVIPNFSAAHVLMF